MFLTPNHLCFVMFETAGHVCCTLYINIGASIWQEDTFEVNFASFIFSTKRFTVKVLHDRSTFIISHTTWPEWYKSHFMFFNITIMYIIPHWDNNRLYKIVICKIINYFYCKKKNWKYFIFLLIFFHSVQKSQNKIDNLIRRPFTCIK